MNNVNVSEGFGSLLPYKILLSKLAGNGCETLEFMIPVCCLLVMLQL